MAPIIMDSWRDLLFSMTSFPVLEQSSPEVPIIHLQTKIFHYNEKDMNIELLFRMENIINAASSSSYVHVHCILKKTFKYSLKITKVYGFSPSKIP